MNRKPFKVSPWLIWGSSLALGLLSSVPKIAERHFNPGEALVNSVLTFLFSVFIWYFNIYMLPKTYQKNDSQEISVLRLLWSLLFGIGMMLALSFLQQFLLPYLDFGASMLMFEVRGVLINLIFFMFLHLLYQSHYNQQVGVAFERSKSINLGAQYELLKQQINPHFLFNSLNTLKYMAETHDEHTVEFILKLSDFYRFTLESRKLDLIRLEEELKIVNAYTFLLKTRFEAGIDLTITVGNQYMNSLLPPFTLQLLIENCVKHNVVSLDKPLWIKIYIDGDYIIIENGIQLKINPETSTGIGLENINQRYLHLLNKKIVITDVNGTFAVKLPIIYEHFNH
ncbi:sensor histidine kinase [Flavobacterium sp. XS2P39]|uniref:sensor histidine kinase n=1 Tax=Flavobacterium sp. XS2P39 TaxID=3401725 RepID=UPI003AAF65F6